ncbi:MAG: glycine--tRNA ligase [Aigarchaeota archaeon]|nr:glycine--tRNA ligase [Aigarchaeota archaeon]MDW8092970.1 glycine--tRNA ligase [Nitrososphaerota archaeon]
MTSYERVLRFALSKGIVFPSCEIYGEAPAGFWEYGPLGVRLRNRFIEAWRRELVRRDEMIEIDGSQIMTKRVFLASGHLESFADPITKCRGCGSIFRADKLIEEKTNISVPERLSDSEISMMLEDRGIRCTNCNGELSEVTRFNMMFKVSVGPSGDEAYLRPETCQSIFVDFLRIYKTTTNKLPLALCQIGKSFRNEISPRQSILRQREFYQAEIEVFFNPKKADEFDKFEQYKDYALMLQPLNEDKAVKVTPSEAVASGLISNRLIAYYLVLIQRFYERLGINRESVRLRQLDSEERAFYARESWDLEVKTSLGWLELVACNNRGDYDLTRHMEVSGQDLSVVDDGERIVPHVFELSMGVDRSLYLLLEHLYLTDSKRTILRLPYHLAPIQVAVFPLVDKGELTKLAERIYNDLKVDFDSFYDSRESIGRRYRKMDELGTPFCVTVDHQSLEDGTVTVRDRDTMSQIRVPASELKQRIQRLLEESWGRACDRGLGES